MAQFQHVQPGDLITSELMNQVLDEIVSLRTAIDALQVAATNVFIFEVRGTQPFRPGSIVTIVGQGFVVPASLNAIAIGGVSVGDVTGVSTELVVRIPDSLVVGTGGQTFELIVNNLRGTAKFQLKLEPKQEVPFGHSEVLYASAPIVALPGNVVAGSIYTFGFRLTAFASRTGTYAVSLSSSNPAWNAVLLDAVTDVARSSNLFQIAASPNSGISTDVRVRVTTGPAASTSTLRIDVVETTPGTQVTPANTSVALTVGQPPPVPQNTIRIIMQNAQAPAVIDGTGVRFSVRNAAGAIFFRLILADVENYNLSAELSQPAGWSAPILPNNPLRATGPSVPLQVPVGLTAGDAAKNTELRLTLVKANGAVEAKYTIALTVPQAG